MTPVNLFDAAQAAARKEEGMARAAAAKPELLAKAQEYARRIARMQGVVTADDVAAVMARHGMDYSQLGNAAGSVFRGMVWTRETTRSVRPSTHGRILRSWRIRREDEA